MAEWLKAHAWKACILQKGIEGSNPSLSAKIFRGKILARSRLVKIAKQFLQGGSARNGMMHHVYILLNEAKTRTYTGVADDVDKRLGEHNAGRVKSSRPYRPYKVIHTESFKTLSEARQKEKFYKSATGRRRLKDMFFK